MSELVRSEWWRKSLAPGSWGSTYMWSILDVFTVLARRTRPCTS